MQEAKKFLLILSHITSCVTIATLYCTYVVCVVHIAKFKVTIKAHRNGLPTGLLATSKVLIIQQNISLSATFLLQYSVFISMQTFVYLFNYLTTVLINRDFDWINIRSVISISHCLN